MIRPALVALVLLTATACGTSSRPATAVRWQAGAQSTRSQWYRSLGETAVAPITLSSRAANRALADGAHAAGVQLVQIHYESSAGGSAELVIQPEQPTAFAEAAGTRLSPLLRTLTDGDHAYLVTVIDEAERPLLMLGWTPGVGGGSGEGIAWQADGIRSSAIIGQAETSSRTEDRLLARLPGP